MKISVYSLKGIEFEGEVRSFNVKAKNGEITVLENHRPLVTLLEQGNAKIGLPDGGEKEIKINSGFLEVDDRNNLSVLVD